MKAKLKELILFMSGQHSSLGIKTEEIHWMRGTPETHQFIPCGLPIGTTYAPRDGSKANCRVCKAAYEMSTENECG
jgi:hypothetical protein